MIRGYVDAPDEVAEVMVHQPVLVIESLAFPLIIGTYILRAYGAVLTLDESASLRLRERECAVCREERIASSAKPFSAAGAVHLPPVLHAVNPLPPQAPPRQARAPPHPFPDLAPPSPLPLQIRLNRSRTRRRRIRSTRRKRATRSAEMHACLPSNQLSQSLKDRRSRELRYS